MFGTRKTQSTSAVSTGSGNNQSMSQNTPRQPVGFETVLGANSNVTGEFKSQANVRLDGTFEGNLQIDGNILIGVLLIRKFDLIFIQFHLRQTPIDNRPSSLVSYHFRPELLRMEWQRTLSR